jgi:hypothetical protein
MAEEPVVTSLPSENVGVSTNPAVTAPARAPDVPKLKRRGRGVDLSSLSPEELKAHTAAINEKSRATKKAKEEKRATYLNSPVELKPKEAAEFLRERGLTNEHVITFCVELAQLAARHNKIPFNQYLLTHGLRATLGKDKLAEIPKDEIEGEILLRPDLHALWDYGYWRHPEATFEEWLETRRRLKSSAFELSKVLGKEDFGEKHEQWTCFLPRWNPIGLRPGYTQQQGLTWLGDQRSDLEGDKKKYLLVCSRNSFKSTFVRIHALCLTICYPDARILIISETNRLSKRGMKEFRGYLELAPNNPTEFQQLFGEFCVAQEDGSSLTYENPLAHLGLPQSSVEQSSMESANTGSRFDYAIFDDPISRDNGTSNEEQRAAALAKFGSIMRLREPQGFACNVQTPWVPDDLGDTMIQQNDKDPEHPLAVRIDPVMEIKEEAKGKGLLDLVEQDVVLNFLPKLNWRFVRDEMRSPEGLKFFRTQYLCQWVQDAEVLRVQFDADELRARTRASGFFGNPTAQIVMSLDRAFSVSRYADFSCLVIGKVQPVSIAPGEMKQALVVADVKMERWRESDLIKNCIEMISRHHPTIFVSEQDRNWQDLADGIRRGCIQRGIAAPYFRWKAVQPTDKAKARRVKGLEQPLSDGRLWFYLAPWTETALLQMEKYDANIKSNNTRKDDFPDALSLLWQECGPRHVEEIAPEDIAARNRERAEEDRRLAKQHFYDRMHGGVYGGTRFNPGQPTPPAPTWRELLSGTRDPQPEEPAEPARPSDPRMRIFGGKGPWRM